MDIIDAIADPGFIYDYFGVSVLMAIVLYAVADTWKRRDRCYDMEEYKAKPYHGLRKFAEHLFVYAAVVLIVYQICYIIILVGHKIILAI